MIGQTELEAELMRLRRQLAQSDQAFRAIAQGAVDSLALEGVAAPLQMHPRLHLRDSESLMQAIFDRALDAVILADDAGTWVAVNAAACELFALPREQLLGRTMRDMAAPNEEVQATWQQFLQAGQLRGRLNVLRRDGTRIATDFNARANILPGVHLTILRDVSENERVQAALRASEERYRRMIETTSEGVVMFDASLRITFANRRLGELLACPPDRLLGRSIADFLCGDQAAQFERDMRRGEAGLNGQYEVSLRRPGASSAWVSLSVNTLVDREGRYDGALALATDISERRRAEELRGQLLSIIESSDDAIFSVDLHGWVRSWSQGAQRLLGYTPQEAIGTPFSLLAPPARAHEASELLHRIAQGESVAHFETLRLRKDHSLVEVALTLSPIRDARGDVVGASAIERDLTEHRKTEYTLRQIEQQLHQAQKMEAIGRLAGGVAHDFNNILTVILSYTSALCDEVPQTEPIHADLCEIKRAGERAAVLTRQLLAFSRRQVLQPEPLDLSEVLCGMQNMLRRLLGEDIALSLELASQPSTVLADRGQIEQVVMNLAVNARDAMPAGGSLTIELREVELERDSSWRETDAPHGACVRLRVTDTGMGMDASVRAQIFEPFFTTKPKGKGTGLGLSTVLGIVQQSGGRIHVISAPGAGTTFEIDLPRSEARVVESKPVAPLGTRGGSETILLVEDDEQVRTLARTVLLRHGYSVLSAEHGAEALLICGRHAGPIHLLLTDVVMPLMSGKQLADQVAAITPRLKVLFMSGYTDDAIVHHGVLDPGIQFLPKPLSPEALTRKVREVLDADAVVEST